MKMSDKSSHKKNKRQLTEEEKQRARENGKKGGRPSTLTQELAQLICERIATHDCSTRQLCEMYDDMPSWIDINRWRWYYPWFKSMYAEARKAQADNMAESLDDLSRQTNVLVDEHGNRKVDNGHVQSLRLQVDTRKWLASKVLPKMYGTQVELDQTKQENEQLKQELQELRSKLDYENKSEY